MELRRRNFLKYLSAILGGIALGYVISPKKGEKETKEILMEGIISKVKGNVCMIIAGHKKTEEIERLLLKDPIKTGLTLLLAIGRISKGSGFLIKDGRVVTAAHVVKNAVEEGSCIEAYTPRGELIPLKLLEINDHYDLAVFEPAKKWGYGLRIIDDLKSLTIAETVFTLGYPLAYYHPEPLLSVGYVSNIVELQNKIFLNISFNNGNSGGPVINLDGLVVGVAQAKSILTDPLLNIYTKILSHPGVEIEYGKLQLPDGSEMSLTLSNMLILFLRWVSFNLQTNIGIAISSTLINQI